MRVALYMYSLRSAGGAERMLVSLANALASRGHTVHVLTWDAAGSKTFYQLDNMVCWHKMEVGSGLRDKLRRISELRSVIRENQLDVFVGFVMSGDKTIYAATYFEGVPLVVAERNAPSMYWLRYGVLHRSTSFALMHLASRITVQQATFAIAYPRTVRDRVVIIHNPVRIPASMALPAAPNGDRRFTLLVVGRLDNIQKRLDLGVRAFAVVAQEFPDWDLVLAGDGPNMSDLKKLAQELGLPDRVIFKPANSDVSAHYVSANLFLIPSLWEGFPNALAEALAHGLPAVGFANAEGVRDLIVNGETGWLATDGVAGLSSALKSAVSAPSEREQRGKKAVTAMNEYAPETQFDRWENLLSEVREERNAK